MEVKKDTTARSWFCVLNNPVEHGFSDDPQKCCEEIADIWCNSETRVCAVAYCISEQGLHHCHAVFEDDHEMRFSRVKKLFPTMHIEPTAGNKKQAEDYINKRGKFEEKGERIIYIYTVGEIKGKQGKRSDVEAVEQMLNEGLTPREIVGSHFKYARMETYIKRAFYLKRYRETPVKRDVKVYWHVGEAGTGKSYTYVQKCEEIGEDHVFFCRDYSKGGMDSYCAESCLILDEYKGQMRFADLLTFLDPYKGEFASRYVNGGMLWNEVHITSVFPPEEVYKKNVDDSDRHRDSYNQLKRRITSVIYHYKKVDGTFATYECPISEYVDYSTLKARVQILESGDYPIGCYEIASNDEDLPFTD